MLVGHLAVALAAKRATPRLSLGLLALAAQWLDVLWPIFLLVGLEQVAIEPGITRLSPFDFVSYPYSHSLTWVLGWAALVGLVYLWRKQDTRGALVLAALVASHWALDLLTHRPDLPLTPSFGPKVGLGLWDSIAGTLLVEGGLFVTGLYLYIRTTRARDGTGRIGIWIWAAILVGIWVSGLFGPPPPAEAVPHGIAAVTLAGQALWLGLAFWIDRHRVTGEPR